MTGCDGVLDWPIGLWDSVAVDSDFATCSERPDVGWVIGHASGRHDPGCEIYDHYWLPVVDDFLNEIRCVCRALRSGAVMFHAIDCGLAYAQGWEICDVNPGVTGCADEELGSARHAGSWMCGDDLRTHCVTWCVIECDGVQWRAGDCQTYCDHSVHSDCANGYADASH